MNVSKCIIFLISLLISLSGRCVDLLDISHHEAIKRAKKENKVVFFQLYSGECGQCDEVAKRGLSGKALDELFEQVIAVGIEPTSSDAEFITNKYRLKPEASSSLIIDKEGNFISAMLYRTTSNSDDYFKLVALALKPTRH